jgi:hypothetical protein
MMIHPHHRSRINVSCVRTSKEDFDLKVGICAKITMSKKQRARNTANTVSWVYRRQLDEPAIRI